MPEPIDEPLFAAYDRGDGGVGKEELLIDAFKGQPPELTDALLHLQEFCARPTFADPENPGSDASRVLYEYINGVAETQSWEILKDDFGNRAYVIPAQGVAEDAPEIVIQCHADGVAAPVRDYDADPIKPQRATREIPPRSGNMVEVFEGKDSSCLFDNRAALAIALGVLTNKEIKRPRVRLVVTDDEETGLHGAKKLGAELLGDARFVLNLDNELDGTSLVPDFIVAYAGGSDVTAELDKQERTPAPENHVPVKVSVSGFPGGHSGVLIHEGRRNANKILAEVIEKHRENTGSVLLASFEGGTVHNKIPKVAEAVLWVSEDEARQLEGTLKGIFSGIPNLRTGLRDEAPAPILQVERFTEGEYSDPFTTECGSRVLAAIHSSPDGILSMSEAFEGLVETSSNLFNVRTTEDGVVIGYSIRAMHEDTKAVALDQIKAPVEKLGLRTEVEGSYPSYEAPARNPLLDIAVEQQKALRREHGDELFPREPLVGGIHAGLEFGICIDRSKLPSDEISALSAGLLLVGAHEKIEAMGTKSAFALHLFLESTLGRMAEYKI